MKQRIEDELGQFCTYCKEPILYADGFVFKKDKYYHLECYHLMIDLPLDSVDAEETID